MMAGRLTEALREDHVQVLEKLAQLGRATAALGGSESEQARATLTEVADFLDKELRLHLRKEEEILFPPLEAVIGRDMGPIAVMRQEHEEIRSRQGELLFLVEELGEGENSAEIRRRIQQVSPYLRNLLTMHIHKEDFVLFPMAEQALQQPSWEEMERKVHALAARGGA